MFRRSAMMLGLFAPWLMFRLNSPDITFSHAGSASRTSSRRTGKGRGRHGASKPMQVLPRRGGAHTKAARQRRRSLRLRRG